MIIHVHEAFVHDAINGIVLWKYIQLSCKSRSFVIYQDTIQNVGLVGTNSWRRVINKVDVIYKHTNMAL